jgi:hypothetical protein
MADERGSDERSLEARVAELEDKLSGTRITAEDMAAFRKVSAAIAAQQGTAVGGVSAGAAAGAAAGAIDECGVNECGVIRWPVVIRHPIVIRQPIIRQCTFECGPGLPGGDLGGSFGAFGAFGG